MLRHSLLFSVTAFITIIAVNCSEVSYDHPLDISGINKDLYQSDPSAFEDSDSDGIVNFLDPDDTTHNFGDKTPPIITLVGPDTVLIPLNDPNNQVALFLDQYTAVDNSGKEVNRLQTESNIDAYTVNTDGVAYEMTYRVSDVSGNVATKVRYFFVFEPNEKDVNPPVIALGDSLIETGMGTPYVDPVVRAYDYVDGDVTADIVRTGEVNTNVEGDYTLIYTVSDASGNTASETRTVRVSKHFTPDLTNPVITLNPPDTVVLGENERIVDFMETYVEPGYTATDDRDGDITANVTVSSFTMQSPKYWYITYEVTDSAGNNATPVRRFFQTGLSELAEPPIIDLEFPDSTILILLPNGTWQEPGYTASDINDGDITDQVIVDDSLLMANIGTKGLYTVTYIVTNSIGLTSMKTRSVAVVDNLVDAEAPVIILLGNNPDTVIVNSAATYADPGCVAQDNQDGDLTSKVQVVGTVTMSIIGSYYLTYSVTDNSSHTGKVMRTIMVMRDTSNADLLVRYGVPLPTPLPDMQNKTYFKSRIEGEGGPNLSSILQMYFNWSLASKSLIKFTFTIFTTTQTTVNLTSIEQSFGSPNPAMTLVNTGIEGLDGEYYVGNQGDEFYWVDKEGKFAIVWEF